MPAKSKGASKDRGGGIARDSRFVAGTRKFASYVRDLIENQAGMSVEAFSKKYKLNGATIRNYLNLDRFPEFAILVRLAHALREETGKPVGLITLVGQIDAFNGEAIDPIAAMKQYEPLPMPLEVVTWFEELSLAERIEIAPALQRRMALDVELSLSRGEKTLAVLLKDQLSRQNQSTVKFAETYDVPVETVELILSAGELMSKADLDSVKLKDLQKICKNTKDADGEYGNIPEFYRMVGLVHIRQVIERFMLEQGLFSYAELVNYILRLDGSTASASERQMLTEAVEAMAAREQLISQMHPAYTEIIPTLSEQLGFSSVIEFEEYLRAYCNA